MVRATHPDIPACCPDPEALTAFRLGKLPTASLQAVADHLGGCAACATALIRLQHDRPPLPLPPGRPAPLPFFAEPERAQLEAAAGAAAPFGAPESTLSPPAPPHFPTAPPPAGLPRQVGQYLLLDLLGHGGMGSVYRARNVHLDMAVAVKTLRPEKSGGPHTLERFRRERKLIAALRHPNIVRALDGGEHDGCPYLVMELVDGLDLHRLVGRCGPLTPADACAVIHQAALGLQHVFEAGLIHRDVKPSNLLLTADGVVKVLDLGLARPFTPEDAPGQPLTETGQVVGTADFMAPEQGLDSRAADIRSDLYSLGCTFYKLLTAHAPFEGAEYASSTRKILAHVQQEVPALAPRRPDVHAAVLELLRRMLAKDPARRPATPAEVAAVLGPFAAGADLPALMRRARADSGPPPAAAGSSTQQTPVLTPHGSTWSAEARPQRRAAWRRRPLVWAAAGVLALLALTAVGYFVLQPPPPPPAEVPPAPPVPVVREHWEPGVRHRLLDRAPFPIDDEARARRAPWTHHPETEKLVVTTDGEAFAVLGKVRGADHKLLVFIKQNNNWTGGTGVFFGYQDAVVDGKPGKQFFTVELAPYRKGDLKEPFKLDWVRHWRPSAGPLRGDTLYLHSVPVEQPPPEAALEVIVKRQGKARVHVSWNGTVKALEPLLPLELQPTDFDGAFGIYTTTCAGTYRNATLIVDER
jgi:serine/threonine protein kinase